MNETKTCLAVLAVLACAELFIHTSKNHLSKDLQHLSTVPAIARSFRESKSINGLFLGNSLTREGVSLPIVISRFSGGPLDGVNWQKAYPDDSTISDWYYLYEDAFYRTGSTPDLLIVGFVRSQASDSAAIHPSRIASSSGGLKNVRELFSHDVTDLSGRANYLLASVSSLFANRERLGARIADFAIPDYRETAQYFNEDLRSHAQSLSQQAVPSYNRLLRLARLCRQTSTLLVMVAMPVPEMYQLDAELLKMATDMSAVVIDLRRVDAIHREHFPDGFHLNSAGAVIYSRALAEALEASVPPQIFLRTQRSLLHDAGSR